MLRKLSNTVIISMCLSAVMSCALPESPFPAYRERNLIESSGLDVFSSSRWLRLPGNPNLVLTQVSLPDTQLPAGLPEGTAVYRMEVPNLLKNGSFADPGAVSGLWISSDASGISAAADCEAAPGDFSPLAGNLLHITVTDPQQRIDLDLDQALTTPPLPKEKYIFRFDYRSPGSIVCQIREENSLTTANALYWKLGGGEHGEEAGADTAFANSFTEATQLPGQRQEFPESMNPRYFSFGAYYENNSFIAKDIQKGILQELYVDNFRVLRSDTRPAVSLTLTGADTVLPLVSGRYRFSLFVHRDEPKEAAAGSEGMFYPAEDFTIDVSAANADVFRMLTAPEFSAGTEGWDAKWAELSLDFMVQYPEEADTEDNSLSITLSPVPASDFPQKLDAVSILIAAPRLELLP